MRNVVPVGARSKPFTARRGFWAARGLVCAAALALWLTPAAAPAMSPDSDWGLELRGGFSWLRARRINHGGLTAAAAGGWRFWNVARLEADVGYSVFGVERHEQTHVLNPSLGLVYEIDRLPVVPAIGVYLGPQAAYDGTAHRWRMDADLTLKFAAHYFPPKSAWAFGADLRYHYLPTHFLGAPIFFELCFVARREW